MSSNRASTYYLDLSLAWLFRGGLLLGLLFIALLVGNCSGKDSSYDARLPPLILGGGDKQSETRNSPTPYNGGDYEKSDCAPPRKPAG